MQDTAKKQMYVVFIVLFVLLIVYFLVDMFFTLSVFVKTIFLIVLILIFLAVLIIKAGFILFLQEHERAVISRFGRVHRVSGPGWAIMIPLLETFKKVDLRVATLDVPKQEVITKDNVVLKIDVVIYLMVKKDPQSVINSVVNVEDYKQAAQLYVKSTVRELIGGMTLDETIGNINELNKKMIKEISEISKDWGVTVQSVEIKEIIVPEAVVDAMHKQKAAVQQKLATKELAEAEKMKIEAINQAASGLSQQSITYYYIKALEEMSKGAATKIIFPMEFSRLAEILAGKMAPGGKEKSKVELFLEKYGDILEEKLLKVEEEKKP